MLATIVTFAFFASDAYTAERLSCLTLMYRWEQVNVGSDSGMSRATLTELMGVAPEARTGEKGEELVYATADGCTGTFLVSSGVVVQKTRRTPGGPECVVAGGISYGCGQPAQGTMVASQTSGDESNTGNSGKVRAVLQAVAEGLAQSSRRTTGSRLSGSEEEISLFNGQGQAVAYIDVDDDLTIYLWGGKPVAYLVSSRRNDGFDVYGFNGKHLGWFVDGVVWNHDGDAACAMEYRIRTAGFEPFKGFQQFKPFKAFETFAPFRPSFSVSFGGPTCALMLAEGR